MSKDAMARIRAESNRWHLERELACARANVNDGGPPSLNIRSSLGLTYEKDRYEARSNSLPIRVIRVLKILGPPERDSSDRIGKIRIPFAPSVTPREPAPAIARPAKRGTLGSSWRRSARFAALVRRVGLDDRILAAPNGGRSQ